MWNYTDDAIPGISWTEDGIHLYKLMMSILLPCVVVHVIYFHLRFLPICQKWRKGPALYSIGGMSGTAIIYDNIIEPTAGILEVMIIQASYFLFGALCMSKLETQNEEQEHIAFQAKMAEYKASVAPDVYARLVDDLGDPDAFPWRNWDIAGSFYYCCTLCTTIGYGSFGPATDGGKLFTAVYVMFGIPMFLSTLALAGDFLPKQTFGFWMHWIEVYMRNELAIAFGAISAVQAGPNGQLVHGTRDIEACKRVLRSDKKLAALRFQMHTIDRYFEEEDDGDGLISDGELAKVIDRIISLVHGELAFCISLVLLLLFVIGLPLTTGLQFLHPTLDPPWSAVEALHFSVITFTTVGLGDYVLQVGTPTSLWGDLFDTWQCWYIFFGLMCVAGVLAEAKYHFRVGFLYSLFITLPFMALLMASTETACFRRCPCAPKPLADMQAQSRKRAKWARWESRARLPTVTVDEDGRVQLGEDGEPNPSPDFSHRAASKKTLKLPARKVSTSGGGGKFGKKGKR